MSLAQLARTDVVEVRLFGPADAVLALSRALAGVTTIGEMRHHVAADGTVRVDATCHIPRRIKVRVPARLAKQWRRRGAPEAMQLRR